jgi:cyclase
MKHLSVATMVVIAASMVSLASAPSRQHRSHGESVTTGSQARRSGEDATIQVSRLAPHYHLLSEPDGNVVVYNGPDMSVVMGVQRPSLVRATKELLKSLSAQPVRYALMMEDDGVVAEGDGGWAASGAITFAHERLYYRMLLESNKPEGFRNALPAIGFSQVIQLYSAAEELHFMRHRAGYTDADVIVHCENEGIVYLGNTFTMDGYPTIDATKLGTVDGIITTADHFVVNFGNDPAKIEPIVPGRGPAGQIKDLREFRDMLVAIRGRVDEMVRRGLTVDEVIQAKPTADFDARWGHGPVTPEAFTRMVHRSVLDAWLKSRLVR